MNLNHIPKFFYCRSSSTKFYQNSFSSFGDEIWDRNYLHILHTFC